MSDPCFQPLVDDVGMCFTDRCQELANADEPVIANAVQVERGRPPHAASHAALEVLADPALPLRLSPIFTTDFKRTTRLLEPAAGTRIELCVGAINPFWRHPCIVITPHDACEVSVEAIGATFRATAEAIRAGRRPPHSIDRERGY